MWVLPWFDAPVYSSFSYSCSCSFSFLLHASLAFRCSLLSSVLSPSCVSFSSFLPLSPTLSPSLTPLTQDAYLPQRLLDKLMIMYNYVEMARVTGETHYTCTQT